MLQNIVVVDRLLEQAAGRDARIYGCGSGIRQSEERIPFDLTEESAVDFDARIRTDHLQVEDDTARFHRLNHVAKNVTTSSGSTHQSD